MQDQRYPPSIQTAVVEIKKAQHFIQIRGFQLLWSCFNYYSNMDNGFSSRFLTVFKNSAALAPSTIR